MVSECEVCLAMRLASAAPMLPVPMMLMFISVNKWLTLCCTARDRDLISQPPSPFA